MSVAEWLACAVVGMTWGSAAVLIRREWKLARAPKQAATPVTLRGDFAPVSISDEYKRAVKAAYLRGRPL